MSIEKFNSKTEVTHEIVPFTQINRNVIQNFKDMLAGYVWVYLLSMPADWIVIKEQLKTHFKLGDKKLKTIFSTLNAHNLIRYEKIIDEKTNRVLKWKIHVLNGSNFIQVPEKIKKTYPQSTGSISTRVEIHTSGKAGTTKKIQYKEDKKTKKEGKNDQRFSLSFLDDFSLSKKIKDLIEKHGINEESVKTKFRNHLEEKRKKTFKTSDLENWFISEVQFIESIKDLGKKEIKSTVPFYDSNKKHIKVTDKNTAKSKINSIREDLNKKTNKCNGIKNKLNKEL